MASPLCCTGNSRVPSGRWTSSKAPGLIDGRYPYLFAVRDLASGMQLHWEPVVAMTAEETMAALPQRKGLSHE